MTEEEDVKNLLAIMVDKYVPFLNNFIHLNPNCPHYEKINQIRLLFIGKKNTKNFKNPLSSVILQAEAAVLTLMQK